MVAMPIVGARYHGIEGVTVVFLKKGAIMTKRSEQSQKPVAMGDVWNEVLSLFHVEFLL